MSKAVLKLKKAGYGSWQLYGPKGNTIGSPFRGPAHKAREWATNFVSSWSGWTVDVSDCYDENEIRPHLSVEKSKTRKFTL